MTAGASRIGRALLRIPLFYKILLANLGILGVAGVAAILSTHRVTGHMDGADLVEILLLSAAVALPLAALLNGALVRLALDPLSRLEETADRIRQGDLGARMAPSPIADVELERVGEVFNEMLDTLDAAGRRQRELSQAVIEAQERERQRLSSELYAGTAQTLAGVLMRLRVAARRSEGEPEALGEIRQEIARALDEVRVAARALRPPELDELGIQAALEAHARAITEGRGIRVAFEGRVPDSALSRPVRLAFFRVLQEAITNAVKHSRAEEVDVTVKLARDGVAAVVSDRGRGFDPSEAQRHPGSLGLVGMQERIQYVGGTLALDSAPGRGTRVSVHVPWTTADAPARTGRARGDAPRAAGGAPSRETLLVGRPRLVGAGGD